MDAPRFPLTRLPVPCVKNLLRTMSPLQLVVYSLLSNKCKNQVTSLNISTKEINIHYGQDIVIVIKFQRDMLAMKITENNEGTLRKVSLAIIRDGRSSENCSWDTNQVGAGYWVEQLKSVFPNSDVKSISFCQQWFRFDLDIIKETFPNIHKLSIKHTGSFAFNRLILKTFLPTEDITISHDCFLDNRVLHTVLIQNFNMTGVTVRAGVFPYVTLNELLINNSKEITLLNPQISSKDLNRFIKLWMKGANPRMEWLNIFKTNGITYKMKDVSNRIGCQRMPATLTRMFKHNQTNKPIYGGLDFHRKDGTKATIGLSNHAGRHCFSMVVWHDHCIGSL